MIYIPPKLMSLPVTFPLISTSVTFPPEWKTSKVYGVKSSGIGVQVSAFFIKRVNNKCRKLRLTPFAMFPSFFFVVFKSRLACFPLFCGFETF